MKKTGRKNQTLKTPKKRKKNNRQVDYLRRVNGILLANERYEIYSLNDDTMINLNDFIEIKI